MGQPAVPNFLVVGAAKSGTTSLFSYLLQHPQVYIPRSKESFFFLSSIYRDLSPADPHAQTIKDRMVTSWPAYRAMFSDAGEASAVGEVGTFYGYHHETAIPLIRQHLGDVRIVFLLRNPVARAHSAYTHFRGYGVEKLPFDTALEEEERRIADHWYTMWYYKAVGRYPDQIDAYRRSFSQVAVYLYDDLRHAPLALMKEVYRFLGVDDEFRPNVKVRYMVSGTPRSSALHGFLMRPNALRTLIRPLVRLFLSPERRYEIVSRLNMRNIRKDDMKPETHRYLCGYFRDDVRRLGEMLGRNLNHWVE